MAKKDRPKKPPIPLSYSKDPPPKVNRQFVVSGVNDTAENWQVSGSWLIVNSSNVAAIRYDMEASELYVQFIKSRSTYVYTGVPIPAARDMYYVSSMGGFVHQRLKGQYPFRIDKGIQKIIARSQISPVKATTPIESATKPEETTKPQKESFLRRMWSGIKHTLGLG